VSLFHGLIEIGTLLLKLRHTLIPQRVKLLKFQHVRLLHTKALGNLARSHRLSSSVFLVLAQFLKPAVDVDKETKKQDLFLAKSFQKLWFRARWLLKGHTGGVEHAILSEKKVYREGIAEAYASNPQKCGQP
jgi:hypothetical protein